MEVLALPQTSVAKDLDFAPDYFEDASCSDSDSPSDQSNLEDTPAFTQSVLYEVPDSEILPTESMVEIESYLASGTEPVFLIPGFEGVAGPLECLAQSLIGRVWVLQCTKDTAFDSVQDIAQVHTRQIRSMCKRGPYTLIGYSFGACVALEIAQLLRAENEPVNLCLMEGSPDFIHAHTRFIESDRRKATENDAYPLSLATFAAAFRQTALYEEVN